MGEFPGEFNADRATADEHHGAGAFEVLMQLGEARPRDRRIRRGVLRGEGVGRACGEHEVVSLDRVVPVNMHGGAFDARNGAVNETPPGEQVRVGHEDRLFPDLVHGGTQSGCVVHELVLLFNEDDLGDRVEALRDGDSAVSTADDDNTSHGVLLQCVELYVLCHCLRFLAWDDERI